MTNESLLSRVAHAEANIRELQTYLPSRHAQTTEGGTSDERPWIGAIPDGDLDLLADVLLQESYRLSGTHANECYHRVEELKKMVHAEVVRRGSDPLA